MRNIHPSPRKQAWLPGLLLLVASALLLLGACTGAAPVPAQPEGAAQAPVPSGEDITVVLPFLEGGITSFDHAYWTSQLLISQGTISEGLYGYDPQLNVIPKVVESATPSEDNAVWTFRLRQDKRWSNGDPVTANDFYVAWMRFLSPELADAPMWASFLQQVQNGWAYKSGAATADEVGIKLIDDYTLEVTLSQPNAALPNLLVLASSQPIHAATLAEHPNDWWDPQHAIYNGPYVVQSWVSGGDTVLARNPHYVGEGIGNVPTVALRPYADPNARLQAFENGEIHFTFLEDTSQVQYARNNPLMSDNIHEDLNLSWSGVQFNRAANDGPWNDILVREAFAMAIDKQAIAELVLRGLAEPTTAFSGDPAITEQITPLPFDVDGARQRLADAGFPNGQGFPEVTFYAPPANHPDMPVIEAIAKMWEDNLGVQVTIQNNEGPVYSSIQWGSINPNVQPGYTMLSGPLNWFEPIYLLEISDHTWYFMDFLPGWKAKAVEYDNQIAAVRDLTAVGDWAELEQRAADAWAARQEIIAQEDNEWGQDMTLPPTFMDQFEQIAARFDEAADDATRLSAYKDALSLVLNQERDIEQYHNLTDANREAQRFMARLRKSTMDTALETVIPLQQLAVDAAWMVPIYVRKIIYATDPRLSGIVQNKLSWGNIFQFQYLQWTE